MIEREKGANLFSCLGGEGGEGGEGVTHRLPFGHTRHHYHNSTRDYVIFFFRNHVSPVFLGKKT